MQKGRTGLYHVMYPLVFFYSSDPKKELNEKKELVKNSGSGTEWTLRSFVGESIRSATFSKDGDSVEVMITSSGTIIVESNDENKVKQIVNSFLFALSLLTGRTCFFCQSCDLNKIRIEPNGGLSPQINHHWSIGRVVASSKDHFEDEVRFSMIGPVHEDKIDQVMGLANEFYRSKHVNLYMRGYEAVMNSSKGNLDTAFILWWIQIELFLKNYSKKAKVTPILRSLMGVDEKGSKVDKNGNKIERKQRIGGKYIPVKLAKDLRDCYDTRNELAHEGRVCTEEEVEKCRSITVGFWNLVKLDKIDYELYLENVNKVNVMNP